MKKNNKKITKSSYDELMDSLTPHERMEFRKEYRELVLSELLIALMNEDNISVRKLAKEAGLSPSSIQGIRSGDKDNITMKNFFRILDALGCSFEIKKGNLVFPVEIVVAAAVNNHAAG